MGMISAPLVTCIAFSQHDCAVVCRQCTLGSCLPWHNSNTRPHSIILVPSCTLPAAHQRNRRRLPHGAAAVLYSAHDLNNNGERPESDNQNPSSSSFSSENVAAAVSTRRASGDSRSLEEIAVSKASLAEEDQVVAETTTDTATAAALTGTVNERLLVELQQAARQEQEPKSKLADRLRQFSFKSSKTEAERQAAIAEARNLNGVNPLVALLGATFALACAVGLWTATYALAEYFAMHPIDENGLYIVTRVTAVSRNIVMGLVSLASGFFGVTGLGILLLAVRVAYGVATGELDPTPIKPNSQPLSDKQVDVGSMWDLMLNKKNKRGRR
jgi:hypothetical protein